jgi:hypothetical protein
MVIIYQIFIPRKTGGFVTKKERIRICSAIAIHFDKKRDKVVTDSGGMVVLVK